MRIQVLSDNRHVHESLETEHGLSILLETGSHKYLLDAGASDLLMRNATRLGIDLAEVDYVFISHGHADHTGGLVAFLEMNSKAKVIVSAKAFTQRFFSVNNCLREISSSPNLLNYQDRYILVDQPTAFEDNVLVMHCYSQRYPAPKANKTLLKEMDGELRADDFDHELVFCCGSERIFVYTGCAHHGLLNILDSVDKATRKPVSVLAGGFHLLDSPENRYETEEEILSIATQLSAGYPETYFYTGHCTGNNVMNLLRSSCCERMSSFFAGFLLDFND